MKTSIISAVDKNFLIGNSKNNTLPWKFKSDLMFFKELTLYENVLMGYNTYLSIGHGLKDRNNIVLTTKNIILDDAVVLNDIESVIKINLDELFIIGGSKIYSQFINIADTIYLTHIDYEFDGDIYFPKIDLSLYKSNKITECVENNVKLTFVEYIK
jgi:dihydrofolate reductase